MNELTSLVLKIDVSKLFLKKKEDIDNINKLKQLKRKF